MGNEIYLRIWVSLEMFTRDLLDSQINTNKNNNDKIRFQFVFNLNSV